MSERLTVSVLAEASAGRFAGRLEPEGRAVRLSGDPAALTPGWRLTGAFEPRGDGLVLRSWEQRAPGTPEALASALEAGWAGIGPKTAQALASAARDPAAAWEALLAGEPEALSGAFGRLTPGRVKTLVAGGASAREREEALRRYAEAGLLGAWADWARANAVDGLAEPYALLDAPGARFEALDSLALARGASPDAPARIRAAMAAELTSALQEGHTALPRERVASALTRRLGLPAEAVEEALPEEPLLALPRLARLERALAEKARRLAETPTELPSDLAARLEALAAELPALAKLDPVQRAALETILGHRLALLTGGPGTGKTTLMAALAGVWEAWGYRVVWAAPTGRAAQRLAEAAGTEASTLHRALGALPDGSWIRSAETPLRADVVVVDEASLLDLELAAALFDALPPLGQLVLVGDADQLPSVGPGAVFRDLIEAGAPTVSLSRVYRQGSASRIPEVARAIREGELPEWPAPGDPEPGGVYFVPAPEPAIAETIVKAVARSLPRRLGLAPGDIQVLAPRYEGPAGVDTLNAALREALNPGAPKGRLGPGDRVLQTRNDAHRGLANGDIGVALPSFSRDGAVRFGERVVLADPAALAPAYALTVHKAQGCEFPGVVLAMGPGGGWTRAALYTAVTRARGCVVVVGDRRALEAGLRREPPRRQTALGSCFAAGG